MATTVSIRSRPASIFSMCPTKSGPTMTTLAWASSMICAISAGARRQLTATLTAPILASPNVTSNHSAPFLSMNATRSPGPTPAARSALAARFERASSSPKVIDPPSASSATASGRAAPWVRMMSAMVAMVMAVVPPGGQFLWSRLRSVLEQVLERRGGVDARVLGQAEHAFADDVAQHLVRAARDAHAGRAAEELGPGEGAPLARVGGEARAEHAGHELGRARHVLGERQLGDRHLGARQLAGADLVEGALVGHLRHLEAGVEPHQLLAQRGVAVGPEVAQHLAEPGDVRQAHAAAPATGADRGPLVHQGRERHRPALVDLAQPVVVGHPHLVEEHLVERRPARHLAQRPHLDAR